MLNGLIQKIFFRHSLIPKIFAICITVTAGEVSANTLVNISGTVLAAPSCIINRNKVINIDFGSNINSLLINGGNYIRDINYELECINFSSDTMRLMLEGTGAELNNNALLTSNPDLAISIKQTGQELPINRWFTFIYPSKPALQAVLIKRAGVNLTPGYFSASATLKIDYQ